MPWRACLSKGPTLTEPEKTPDTLESLAREHVELCDKQIAELQNALKQTDEQAARIQNELSQMAAHRERWILVLNHGPAAVMEQKE